MWKRTRNVTANCLFQQRSESRRTRREVFAQSSGSAITRSLDRDILFKLPKDFNFTGKENSSSESINFSASDLSKSPRRKPLSLSENCSPIFKFTSPSICPLSIWTSGSSRSLPEKAKLGHPEEPHSHSHDSSFQYGRASLFTIGSSGSQKRGHSPNYNLLASEAACSDSVGIDSASHEYRLQAVALSQPCPSGANLSVFEDRGKDLQPEGASPYLTLYTLNRTLGGTEEQNITKDSDQSITSSKLFTLGSNTTRKKISSPTRKKKTKKWYHVLVTTYTLGVSLFVSSFLSLRCYQLNVTVIFMIWNQQNISMHKIPWTLSGHHLHLPANVTFTAFQFMFNIKIKLLNEGLGNI